MSAPKSMIGKTVVAMSGGVDSSVAALLLAKEGRELVGVSMQVWDYRNHGGCSSKATCCAPNDFADARSVADTIDIPYYVFDFEKSFNEKVISRFIDMYANGVTPNPCVDCNNDVKFHELRNRALSLGCDAVATGHYAVIEESEGGYHLYRGKDDRKDQSYFLYGLKQRELSQTLFPLGDLTKDEVRALASEAGLLTAQKPESQDICFVSGTVESFVGKRIGDRAKSGVLMNRSGAILGTHEGIHRFTRGQRKGVGISGSEHPLYVLDIDPESGTVYVGTREELEIGGFTVSELNWVSPYHQNLQEGDEFLSTVQVRHQHKGVLAKVKLVNGKVRVTFIDQWTSPAPGQAAVFYDEENRELLGGGRIEREKIDGAVKSSLQILSAEAS